MLAESMPWKAGGVSGFPDVRVSADYSAHVLREGQSIEERSVAAAVCLSLTLEETFKASTRNSSIIKWSGFAHEETGVSRVHPAFGWSLSDGLQSRVRSSVLNMKCGLTNYYRRVMNQGINSGILELSEKKGVPIFWSQLTLARA